MQSSIVYLEAVIQEDTFFAGLAGGEGQLIMGKKFFYHSCRKIFLSIHSWMIFTLGTAQEKKKC